ncbi:MAG: nucleotidyl transferase AbiEii/AbiGii toxin family protein [Candidatus Aureabacteria bacterium]|nr:nucleotidyl transferase AbiEii/AbiGii toxin family protein [Candidatus Auribacterota bacterium]
MKILTALQEELLRIFAGIEESNLFYLTGGTALAANYLKHRYSRDLDLKEMKEYFLKQALLLMKKAKK